MIGITLAFGTLAGKTEDHAEQRLIEEFGGAPAMIRQLKAAGICSVELRITKDMTPEFQRAALQNVKRVCGEGFALTIHSKLSDIPAAQFFDGMEPILLELAKTQNKVVLTVHSLTCYDTPEQNSRRTVEVLTDWAGYANGFPLEVWFALENTRNKRPVNEFDDVAGVARMLSPQIPRVGANWDIGHHHWNYLNGLNGTQILPPEEFASQVVHTHIHGVQDGLASGTTHYPPLPGLIPLEDACAFLRRMEYAGIYHLELVFGRYEGKLPLRDSLLSALERLRICAQESVPI